MRRLSSVVLACAAAIAAVSTPLLLNGHQSAPDVTADKLPCVVLDFGALGIDRVLTVCPPV